MDRLPETALLARPWRLAALALVALVVSSACDGCDCGGAGTVPDSPTARVEAIAEHLPKKTALLVASGDPAKLRESLEVANAKFGTAVPMSDLIQQQVESELGVDLLDAKSWKTAGLDPDGALALALFEDHPIVLTYVDDKQTFEKHFGTQLKKGMDIEGMPKNKTVGDVEMKIIGAEPGQRIAWMYDGKLAIIALPAVEGADDDKATIGDVLSQVGATTAETSLTQANGFERYLEKMAGDHPLSMYVNNDQVLTEERMAELGGADSKATAQWFKDNVEGAALGMKVEGTQMRFDAWVGLPDELIERARAIQVKPADADWTTYATTNTLAAVRMTADFGELWKLYKETMPEEQRRKMARTLQQTGETAGVDVEKEFIEKISGNAAIFFYGMDPNANPMAMRSPIGALQAAALIGVIQFDDQAAADKLVATIAESAMGSIEVQPVTYDGQPTDVKVLRVKNMAQDPGKIYVHGTTVVLATPVFSEASVYEYMTGKRDEGVLAEAAGLDLGERLATEEVFNGLYVNFVRARDHFSDQLAMLPQVAETLAKLQEAALWGEVAEGGAMFHLAIDLTEGAGDDAKAGDAKAGDAKAGDAKAGDAKAGGDEASEEKPGDAPAGETKGDKKE